MPNWCRSFTHSLIHARCDGDKIERHQWPLQNVNIGKDLYQKCSRIGNSVVFRQMEKMCRILWHMAAFTLPANECSVFGPSVFYIPFIWIAFQLQRCWFKKRYKRKFSCMESREDLSDYIVCEWGASNLIPYHHFEYPLYVHLQLPATHLARRVINYANNFRKVFRA